MFRFTIRDVLWLTALVAMGVAWGADRSRLAKEARDNYGIAVGLKSEKDSLEDQNHELGVLLDEADPNWRKTRGPFLYIRPYDDEGEF
jgi:hypothetical protein